DEDLLRVITERRDWMRLYQVRLGLATNPKTALPVAIRLVGMLEDRDLRQVAKSKNVPQAVAAHARRLLMTTRAPWWGVGGYPSVDVAERPQLLLQTGIGAGGGRRGWRRRAPGGEEGFEPLVLGRDTRDVSLLAGVGREVVQLRLSDARRVD